MSAIPSPAPMDDHPLLPGIPAAPEKPVDVKALMLDAHALSTRLLASVPPDTQPGALLGGAVFLVAAACKLHSEPYACLDAFYNSVEALLEKHDKYEQIVADNAGGGR